MTKYGKILKAVRNDLGYSLAQVAELAGISESTVSKIENHGRIPTAYTVALIADNLWVSMDDLAGRQQPISTSGELSEELSESMTTGERLRAARKAAGLNQRELAEKAGIIPPAISRFELYDGGLLIHNAVKIADVLNVSLDWLYRIK